MKIAAKLVTIDAFTEEGAKLFIADVLDKHPKAVANIEYIGRNSVLVKIGPIPLQSLSFNNVHFMGVNMYPCDMTATA